MCCYSDPKISEMAHAECHEEGPEYEVGYYGVRLT
jgi:hypothetical protein